MLLWEMILGFIVGYVARLQNRWPRVLAAEMEPRVLDKTRQHPSRQHPLEHAEYSTAPENQSQRYGERLVSTIPADGHRL
jgi:hypothetical protein